MSEIETRSKKTKLNKKENNYNSGRGNQNHKALNS